MEVSKQQAATAVTNEDIALEQTTTLSTIEQPFEENYSVGWKTYIAIFALALANCCATFSNTTNTIIKFQVMSVGGAADASWIANSNFLLTLACGPIFGSLTDRLGKKWFIVGGCAIGVIGSFVSSSAKSVYRIIGGNVLTGIAVSLEHDICSSHADFDCRTLVASFRSLPIKKSLRISSDRMPSLLQYDNPMVN